ncbi:MAG: hypothetical protein D3909_13585 [Candidatus Electrothrix sp. ATG1]|nr:hypothetical protein [Candidatus Electrothrix sp. ATG1]
MYILFKDCLKRDIFDIFMMMVLPVQRSGEQYIKMKQEIQTSFPVLSLKTDNNEEQDERYKRR